LGNIFWLIVFWLIYRAVVDRKRGRARTSSYGRKVQETGQQAVRPLLLEELFLLDEEELVVDFKERAEFAKETLEGELASVTKAAVEVQAQPTAVSGAESAVDTKVEAVSSKRSVLAGVDLRQAVIWSEILQKPKALRKR
jgi:hypothetical protein